jgi:hypothetical protein
MLRFVAVPTSVLVDTHQLEEQILQKCFICLNPDDAILIPADILYTGNNVGLGWIARLTLLSPSTHLLTLSFPLKADYDLCYFNVLYLKMLLRFLMLDFCTTCLVYLGKLICLSKP